MKPAVAQALGNDHLGARASLRLDVALPDAFGLGLGSVLGGEGQMCTPCPQRLPLPLEAGLTRSLAAPSFPLVEPGAGEGSAQPAICCCKHLGLRPSMQTRCLSFLPLPRSCSSLLSPEKVIKGGCRLQADVQDASWPVQVQGSQHFIGPWAARAASPPIARRCACSETTQWHQVHICQADACEQSVCTAQGPFEPVE